MVLKLHFTKEIDHVFKAIGNLGSAAVNVALTPVAAAADIVTLGGLNTDQAEPYTVQRLKEAKRKLDDARDETYRD